MKIKASIIIRTCNEEDWIRHCLQMLRKQSEEKYEIIIVDNNSTDNTIHIAKSFKIKKIYRINKYFPGKSLNIGCQNADGEFLVFLSSHCIPENENWLKNILINFKNTKVAGVYGRQSPIKFSRPKDIRDLYITFGIEKKIQKKDHFFHNANSAIRKKIWEKIPFNEKLTNIEDRDWAKKIIKKNYWIIYEPKANVFHYHGIHHDSDPKRLKKTIEVINKIENNMLPNLLPTSLKPENINLQIIIHLSKYEKKQIQNQSFLRLTSYINDFKKNVRIMFIKPKEFPKSLIPENYSIFNINKKKFDLSKTLIKCIKKSSNNNFYSDFVLYLNADYIFRPKYFFENMLKKICYGGYDCLIPATRNYSTNIVYNKNFESFQIYGSDLKNRNVKSPVYSSLYGLGCITKTKIVSKGMLISQKNIGVVTISNKIYTIRLSDFTTKNFDSFIKLFNEKKN